MPIVNSLNKTDSDVVKMEPRGHAGRDDVILAANSGALVPGAILGVVTASGKYAPLAPAAVDGTQTAAGILLEPAANSAADQNAVVLVRGTAEVVAQALVWPAGATAAQKATALSQLESRLITARNGV